MDLALNGSTSIPAGGAWVFGKADKEDQVCKQGDRRRGGAAAAQQTGQQAQEAAEATPPDSDQGTLAQVCKGHVWKLDAYGL